MKTYNHFYITGIILLLIGCTATSTEEEVPDYIHNLKQKAQVPDSLALEIQMDVHQTDPDKIRVRWMMINNGSYNIGFDHSSSFVGAAVYKGTSLLYPDPKHVDSFVYPDDLIRAKISAKDTLIYGNKLLDIPKASNPNIMGYAIITINGIGSHNTKSKEAVWLLSDPRSIK